MQLAHLSLFILSLLLHSLAIVKAVSPSSSRQLKHRVPQEITVIDRETGVTVRIIGCMHYNPLSISTARQAVENLGVDGMLGSVVIESCPKRWSRTLSSQPPGSALRSILDNEMQAAQEACEKFHRPVVLGDQAIDVTNSRVMQSMVQSIQDICSPLSGGWSRLANDINEIFQNTIMLPAIPGVDFLTASDFLYPKLLLSSPVSFVRYPLAILIKSPQLVLGFLCLAFLSGQIDAHSIPTESSLSMQAIDTLESVFSSLAETALLARPMLQAILLERNIILAENIRESCRSIYKEGLEGGVCVAVLGMAHSNGVAKLLA